MSPSVAKPEGYESYRTVSELGKFVGVSTRTVERWYAEGDIEPPAHRTDSGVKLWDPTQAARILEQRLARTSAQKAKERRITNGRGRR